jgi:hypothetical protein
MAPYSERRKADIALRDGARRIVKKSKRFSRKRWAARRTAAAFTLRVAFRRHGYPKRHTKFWTGNFRYGYYGGIGHGIPAGQWHTPLDSLDELYLAHDKTYASALDLARWEERQAFND